MRDPLLRIGAVGTVITALCCFTPVLVWVLVPLGVAGAVAWLDYVLLPLLAVFVLVALIGLGSRLRRRGPRLR